jgi:hypothetical protein
VLIGVVWCGVVWCGVVWCGVVWCGVVWCGVVWCDVVWCCRFLAKEGLELMLRYLKENKFAAGALYLMRT